MSAPVTQYDRVDQWLDWGDHTVTVDPMRNSAWIHEGQDRKHLSTVERGRRYDREDAQRLLGLITSTPKTHLQTYLPQTSDIGLMDGLQRKPGDGARNEHGVAPPYEEWFCHRGGVISDDRPHRRPIIDDLHRKGSLPETDRGTIEQLIRQSDTMQQNRVFDCKTECKS